MIINAGELGTHIVDVEDSVELANSDLNHVCAPGYVAAVDRWREKHRMKKWETRY